MEMGSWRVKMAEKGWIAPTWPAAYGGGGLSREQAVVLNQEMGSGLVSFRLFGVSCNDNSRRRHSTYP